MTELPLTGGCNCGAVLFEVTEPLAGASYCHCKRSQRRSGAAASANAHPAPGSFRIVSGEDRLRSWEPDGGGEKWFCGDCGSSLFGRNPSHTDPIGIRIGPSTTIPESGPSVRQFVAYAAPWEPIPDDGLGPPPRKPVQTRWSSRGLGEPARAASTPFGVVAQRYGELLEESRELGALLPAQSAEQSLLIGDVRAQSRVDQPRAFARQRHRRRAPVRWIRLAPDQASPFKPSQALRHPSASDQQRTP
jgi:hypothetical protein